MNQILVNNKITIKGYKKNEIYIKNNIYKYYFIFSISIIFAITGFVYSMFGYQNRNYQENLSKKLEESFSLSTLYSNNTSYTVDIDYLKDDHKNEFEVIGIIKIDKIKISYPILSGINDELLKISPCRFFGPTPNCVGNLCIAAHNYDDNRFFSKIRNFKEQ